MMQSMAFRGIPIRWACPQNGEDTPCLVGWCPTGRHAHQREEITFPAPGNRYTPWCDTHRRPLLQVA